MSHVFNFDVPGHPEDYVHRIGRTGRAGREGKAITICIPRDEKQFDAVENLIQKEIPRLENPVKSVPADKTEDAEKSKRSRSKPKPDVEAGADVTSLEDAPKPRSRGGRGRQSKREDRGGSTVVGLGDHTPSFIELSFEQRMAS